MQPTHHIYIYIRAGVLALFTLALVAGPAVARDVQSWDKKIDTNRFEPALDGEAILDKETGLVWERTPDSNTRSWHLALMHCYQREVGGRQGWRVPTIEELASLLDKSNSDPALPRRHPFGNVRSNFYWSATTFSADTTSAWSVHFSVGGGYPVEKTVSDSNLVWCVRGSQIQMAGIRDLGQN